MGTFTNNRGYKIDCCACRRHNTENYNLDGYFTFTPPFANASDSV
jgi:hypothetical protein